MKTMRSTMYVPSVSLLLIIQLFGIVSCDEHERRLYDILLNNYNIYERPVENNTHPVVVNLKVVLNQIVDVDEKNQVVQTNVWLQYKWHDYHLKWDPETFGNVTDLRFPHNKLWKPDVLLYNSVDSNFDNTYPANIVVYSSGEIHWIPPGILRSSCNIDITWFPFDDQKCYLKFGSWTYNGWKLDLRTFEEGIDISEYIENGEWLLIDKSVVRGEKFYECCPEPFPDLKFWLHIRRRTLYYGFNLIIPSLLISLMTLLGFALPVEAGEKITLEITILLSVCVFLSMVAQMTPPTSEAVPLIGAFFSCNMMVVSASVVFNVVVLNLHYRTPDTHTMSPMARRVLLNWLPWLLMMHRPGHTLTRSNAVFAKCSKARRKRVEVESEKLMTTNLCSEHTKLSIVGGAGGGGAQNGFLSHQTEEKDLEQRVKACIRNLTSKESTVDHGIQAVLLTTQQIYAELKFITQRMQHDDQVQDARNEWKFAAMVVDRLCLCVFSLFIVGSTCGIFFSAPHVIA